MLIIIIIVKDTCPNAASIFASSGPMGVPNHQKIFRDWPWADLSAKWVLLSLSFFSFFFFPLLLASWSSFWHFYQVFSLIVSFWLFVSLFETFPSLVMLLLFLILTSTKLGSLKKLIEKRCSQAEVLIPSNFSCILFKIWIVSVIES